MDHVACLVQMHHVWKMVSAKDNFQKTLKRKLAYFKGIMQIWEEAMTEESTKMDLIIDMLYLTT